MPSEAPHLQDGLALIDAYVHTSEPFPVIGIAGGSASGKTRLARMVQSHFSARCGLLSVDNYYHEGKLPNYDVPAAFDFALLAGHVDQLSEGKSVFSPCYDFLTGRRLSPQRLGPFGMILVEGLYALHPSLLPHLTIRVYVDSPPDVRLARRIVRDVRERGRTPSSVVERWQNMVAPMHDLHVAPQKDLAEIVVNNLE